MGQTYQRLSASEREEISRGLGQRWSLRRVAAAVQRSASTVSREVQRAHSRQTYRAYWAQSHARLAAGRRRGGQRKMTQNPRLAQVVYGWLRQRWSPEQIARRLKRTYPEDATMQISHEAIYSALYVLPKGELRRELLACLRRGHQRRHRRHFFVAPRKPLLNMVSIDERPPSVENRRVPGHWEGDLLVGHLRQSALGTLVERTTRYLVLVPLKSKTAEEVCEKFTRALIRLPTRARRTLTYDQGREMAGHKRLAAATRMRVYFAHPASPWERPTSENTNGLIRQFFPRGTDFKKVPLAEVRRVQRLMNGRPRRVLDWQTPDEVWRERVALNP